LIKRGLKNYKFESSAGALLGLSTHPGISAAAVGTGYGALKSFELAHRVFNNPTLRKMYMDSIVEASKGNAAAAARNFKKLDKAMSEKD
jgi:hypothetical protein